MWTSAACRCQARREQLNIPVRSPKLSNHKRVQYSGGGPPGKRTSCSALNFLFFEFSGRGLLPETCLNTRPEFSFHCRMCAEFARQRHQPNKKQSQIPSAKRPILQTLSMHSPDYESENKTCAQTLAFTPKCTTPTHPPYPLPPTPQPPPPNPYPPLPPHPYPS